ncbi:hypothetical protein [Kitasatospora camelliae]|uniref:Uncharacterized protein n=1 Tax=Kitasatospora camelliae TaxID=3156397 RepID=A0AAU8K455_9ACTN
MLTPPALAGGCVPAIRTVTVPRPAAAPAPSAPAPTAERDFHALMRIRCGPGPLDFHRLAARFPAVRSGLALAGEVDLELRLACTGPDELRLITAELLRTGAARVQVELVLRSLTRAADTDPAATVWSCRP